MANPSKAAAVEAINAHLSNFGPVEWGRVESKFPDVPKATLWRWIKEIRDKASDAPSRQKLQAAKVRVRKVVEEVRAVGGMLPATPSPAYLAAKGAEGEASINFLGRVNELYGEAEKLRDFACSADGKIRIPLFYQNSINIRRNLLQSSLVALQQIYDLGKTQALYDAIVEVVGEASPEVQKAVLQRLHRFDRERGITING